MKFRLPRWLQRPLWARRRPRIRLPGRRPRAPGRWIEQRYAAPGARPLDYHLYEPAELGGAGRPLLVMLHGCKQSALEFAAGARLGRLADRDGFLVLCPQQSARANPMRCWNWFDAATLAGQGESGLIADLIRETIERRGVDPRRVHVAGMSAGAAMARILAVRHGGLFARCALHSGLMFGAANSPLMALSAMRSGAAGDPSALSAEPLRAGRPLHPVPTLVIQGLSDRVVNPANADQISRQCCDLAAAAAASGAAPAPRMAVSERSWLEGERQCVQVDYTLADALVVRKITIAGLAHAWSGGDPGYPFNDPAGPDATALMGDFFAAAQTVPSARGMSSPG